MRQTDGCQRDFKQGGAHNTSVAVEPVSATTEVWRSSCSLLPTQNNSCPWQHSARSFHPSKIDCGTPFSARCPAISSWFLDVCWLAHCDSLSCDSVFTKRPQDEPRPRTCILSTRFLVTKYATRREEYQKRHLSRHRQSIQHLKQTHETVRLETKERTYKF